MDLRFQEARLPRSNHQQNSTREPSPVKSRSLLPVVYICARASFHHVPRVRFNGPETSVLSPAATGSDGPASAVEQGKFLGDAPRRSRVFSPQIVLCSKDKKVRARSRASRDTGSVGRIKTDATSRVTRNFLPLVGPLLTRKSRWKRKICLVRYLPISHCNGSPIYEWQTLFPPSEPLPLSWRGMGGAWHSEYMFVIPK
jgi:hypothetical protein